MLAIFSGRIIYIFGIPERLRTLRYAIFTGEVVKATGICSACFLRKYGANPLSHRCTMPAPSPRELANGVSLRGLAPSPRELAKPTGFD